MTNKKAQCLIELVKDKTLLREAPNRREVILHVYGIDIDDTKDWDRHFAKRNFTALLSFCFMEAMVQRL